MWVGVGGCVMEFVLTLNDNDPTLLLIFLAIDTGGCVPSAVQETGVVSSW